MSRNINVNPGHYKVAGRERQGEDILQRDQKQRFAQQAGGGRRGEVPPWEATRHNFATAQPEPARKRAKPRRKPKTAKKTAARKTAATSRPASRKPVRKTMRKTKVAASKRRSTKRAASGRSRTRT